MKELLNFVYKGFLKTVFTIHPSISRMFLYPTIQYFLTIKEKWWTNFPDDGVVVGKLPLHHHVNILVDLGVKTIIVLTENFETIVSEEVWHKNGIEVVNCHTPDFEPLTTVDTNYAVQKIKDCRTKGGVSYVHCHHGKGRSVSVLICYLAQMHGFVSLDTVLNYLDRHEAPHRLNERQQKFLVDYIDNLQKV